LKNKAKYELHTLATHFPPDPLAYKQCYAHLYDIQDFASNRSGSALHATHWAVSAAKGYQITVAP
jgi:hypothetical protein